MNFQKKLLGLTLSFGSGFTAFADTAELIPQANERVEIRIDGSSDESAKSLGADIFRTLISLIGFEGTELVDNTIISPNGIEASLNGGPTTLVRLPLKSAGDIVSFRKDNDGFYLEIQIKGPLARDLFVGQALKGDPKKDISQETENRSVGGKIHCVKRGEPNYDYLCTLLVK